MVVVFRNRGKGSTANSFVLVIKVTHTLNEGSCGWKQKYGNSVFFSVLPNEEKYCRLVKDIHTRFTRYRKVAEVGSLEKLPWAFQLFLPLKNKSLAEGFLKCLQYL